MRGVRVSTHADFPARPTCLVRNARFAVGSAPPIHCACSGRDVERFLHFVVSNGGIVAMNLVFWLPATFVLGLVVMGLCYAFIDACEKI